MPLASDAFLRPVLCEAQAWIYLCRSSPRLYRYHNAPQITWWYSTLLLVERDDGVVSRCGILTVT